MSLASIRSQLPTPSSEASAHRSSGSSQPVEAAPPATPAASPSADPRSLASIRQALTAFVESQSATTSHSYSTPYFHAAFTAYGKEGEEQQNLPAATTSANVDAVGARSDAPGKSDGLRDEFEGLMKRLQPMANSAGGPAALAQLSSDISAFAGKLLEIARINHQPPPPEPEPEVQPQPADNPPAKAMTTAVAPGAAERTSLWSQLSSRLQKHLDDL